MSQRAIPAVKKSKACSYHGGKGLESVGLEGRSEAFRTANGPEQYSTYLPNQWKAGEQLTWGIFLTMG